MYTCVHNCPTNYGKPDQKNILLFSMNLSRCNLDFHKKNFILYKVYIIDGNHSIKAQKLANKIQTTQCLNTEGEIYIVEWLRISVEMKTTETIGTEYEANF